MGQDLIIGNATGYDWDKIKYWVNSIQRCGFTGSVAVTGTNISGETAKKLTDRGVIVNLFGKQTEDGGAETKGTTIPHVDRFFYISSFLEKHYQEYDRVITTDVRDVVFQTNPSEFLDMNLGMHDLLASGEGLLYKDEPWGNTNLYQAFGPHFHSKLSNERIYNVGVIAGYTQNVQGLLSLIFQLSLGRPIAICDQAVYNYLLNTFPFSTNTYKTENSDAWAVNLGTAIQAVKAGHGDLGALCKDNATELAKYSINYRDLQPEIKDGVVLASTKRPFCIVHQWDRVPELVPCIEEKFAE